MAVNVLAAVSRLLVHSPSAHGINLITLAFSRTSKSEQGLCCSWDMSSPCLLAEAIEPDVGHHHWPSTASHRIMTMKMLGICEARRYQCAEHSSSLAV
jgi:hypothetical protein